MQFWNRLYRFLKASGNARNRRSVGRDQSGERARQRNASQSPCRAKQRAIFMFCPHRGARRNASELYQLLTDAGVEEIEIG
ncbi:hypothetical protein FIV37_07030 [Pseudomonas gessardii]|nr:hypothetical protein [Pseudomonas gessardii]